MSRRATMGGPLAGSSGHNINAGAMDRRKSIGGSKARQSMAPSSSAASATASAASSRQSIGGAALEKGSATARQSLGGAGLRGGVNGATNNGSSSLAAALAVNADRRRSLGGGDRKSGGGRRSSMGARGTVGGSSGARSDPRPLNTKAFDKANLHKIIEYLVRRNYGETLNVKQLTSPSARDVRKILEFLIDQIQATGGAGVGVNEKKRRPFSFDEARLVVADMTSSKPPQKPSQALLEMAKLDYEDAARFWMKKLGFPFAISRSLLQAPGSKGSTVIAMITWLIEVLVYLESREEAASQPGSESEVRLFYDYVSASYADWLALKDDFTEHNELLARKFEMRNEQVMMEAQRLGAKVEEHELVVAQLSAREQTLSDLIAIRNAYLADVPTLTVNIENNKEYQEKLQATKDARAAELEVRNAVLAETKAELAELQQVLARQEYTPLQVQEMLHQKATLESTLEAQQKQQEAVQADIWSREAEVAKKVAAVEAAVMAFNEASAALAEAAQESRINADSVFDHSELRFAPTADTASSMLSMDLKAHKESVSSCKEALQSLRKDLSSELKRHAPALQALQEHESERAAAADALAKRSNKIHELYSAERTKMHRDGEAACALVEDVELQIVTLRNALAGSEALETLQHKQMEQEALLAEQLASMRAANLAEEQALKQMLADSLQQMENHKADVKDRLQQKVAAAQTIRGQIAEINANVYNLDLNHTQ